jgi:hypothetical protein
MLLGVLYTSGMKHFTIETGEFVTTTGVYRVVGHHREATLLQGDAAPTFQKEKVKWRLIRAAPHPTRG